VQSSEEGLLAAKMAVVVADNGLVLDDLRVQVVGSRRIVQLTVDLAEDTTEPVGMEAVAVVSRAVSAALDADEPFGGRPYTLEVSSPGATRPLKHPRHWKRAMSRLVLVKTTAGEKIAGRLREVTDSGPVLEVEGVRRSLLFEEIEKANVEVEFK
jgi:ribosome maturation factor RimP